MLHQIGVSRAVEVCSGVRVAGATTSDILAAYLRSGAVREGRGRDQLLRCCREVEVCSGVSVAGAASSDIFAACLRCRPIRQGRGRDQLLRCCCTVEVCSGVSVARTASSDVFAAGGRVVAEGGEVSALEMGCYPVVTLSSGAVELRAGFSSRLWAA
jgi:hypothetical protein